MATSNGRATSTNSGVTEASEPDSGQLGSTAVLELSICIPTYRRPELLRRALRSVMATTDDATGNVELLVSDNSPAETESLARSLLAEWPGNSTYIGNPTDIGLVGNLNQCIARARGRWVLILHDDDYLVPGAVGAVLDGVRSAEAEDHALLFGTTVVDDGGRVLRQQVSHRDQRLAPAEALRRVLTDSSFVRFPAIAVRHSAYDEVSAFSGAAKGTTDFDMWIRLFARFGVRLMPHPVSAYTVHLQALTNGMFNREYVEILSGRFDEALGMGLLSEQEVHEAQCEWFHQFLLAGAYRSVRAGDIVEARRVLELFDEPSVKALGSSRRWAPIRLGLETICRLPGPLARSAAAVIRPLDSRVKHWMLDPERN